MVKVVVQPQNGDREEDEGRDTERDQNGGQMLDDDRSTTVTNVRDVGTPMKCHSDSAGTSSLVNRGYGTGATCVRLDPTDQRRDHEDVSRTSSTQYSDVDGSVEGEELGSWSNEQGLPVSPGQRSDDNVAPVFVSDVPTVSDVCVKDSPNVHFGQKTFYNGPVTFEKIVCPNPESTEDHCFGDGNRSDEISKEQSDNTDTGTRDQNVDPENSQDHNKVTKWCIRMLTWRCVALMCVIGSYLVIAVVVGVIFLSNGELSFVERTQWGAKPATGSLDLLTLPVPYVIISHTVTEFCETQSKCSIIVRWVQSFHAESRKWSDIGYNFLVGGDGFTYVGRGWDYIGAHSYGYNNRSIGISFIGTFNDLAPPKRQLLAAQQLIELGVKKGKIRSDYKLLGHRQVSRFLSPGEVLYKIIQTWPHWSPTP